MEKRRFVDLSQAKNLKFQTKTGPTFPLKFSLKKRRENGKFRLCCSQPEEIAAQLDSVSKVTKGNSEDSHPFCQFQKTIKG
jgi:hypothetical protein